MLTGIPTNRLVSVLIITNLATYIYAVRCERKANRDKYHWNSLIEMLDYMLDIMHNRGVHMDEFDLIALRAISERGE